MPSTNLAKVFPEIPKKWSNFASSKPNGSPDKLVSYRLTSSMGAKP